jgi:hypothetical protein
MPILLIVPCTDERCCSTVAVALWCHRYRGAPWRDDDEGQEMIWHDGAVA